MSLEKKIVPYCPVTGNQALRCTKAGFLAACAKFKATAAKTWSQRNTRTGMEVKKSNYCLECDGKIRQNVTFIELSKANSKESVMGSAKRVAGVCEACGKEATVSTHFGKMVCSTCLPIRMGAKNNPEVTIASLIEFGNGPASEVAGDHALQKDNEHLRALLAGKDRQIAAMQGASSILEQEIADLNVLIETMKEQIRTAPDTGSCLDAEAKAILNDIIWKIAEGIIEGDVSGIDIDNLRTMRSLL